MASHPPTRPQGDFDPEKDAPATVLRILIADDHDIIRRGLRQLLTDEFSQVIFGEACNGKRVLEMVLQQRWDIILLDLTMPHSQGLDTLTRLKEIQPTARILVLSMHPEDQYAVRVLKAGAMGYLTKNSASEFLPGAIRTVLTGGTYVSSWMAENLTSLLKTDNVPASHETLSERERQVLRMLALGKSVKEIAYELSLSVKTIGTYRTRLLKKLHLKTSADVIRYAIREQLVPI